MEKKQFEFDTYDSESSSESSQWSLSRTSSESSETSQSFSGDSEDNFPNQYDNWSLYMEGSYDEKQRAYRIHGHYSCATTKPVTVESENPFSWLMPTPTNESGQAKLRFPWEFDCSVLDIQSGLRRSSSILELEPDLEPINYQPTEVIREDDSEPCNQSSNVENGVNLATLNDQNNNNNNKSFGQCD